MRSTDTDILAAAEGWRREGRAVALATVIETWGSAPRPVGSHLAVDGEGGFVGSVSGGCVEGEVITGALDVIADGRARSLEFGVADETAWRAGLSCGGRIRVRVERVGAGADGLALDTLAALNAERAARRAAILVTDLDGGGQRLVRGAEIGADPLAGILGDRLRSGRSGLVEVGGRPLFLTVQVPPLRLVVIGAVHISQALCPMALLLGLDVAVIDPRTAFATPERFPGVRLVPEWPDAALARIGPLDRHSALAALTHDPKIDDPALVAALRAGCAYVGALGSRKTHARRVERLTAAGLAPEAVGRLHAPIGLDIGAVSPPEIALSILAELVAILRRGGPAP